MTDREKRRRLFWPLTAVLSFLLVIGGLAFTQLQWPEDGGAGSRQAYSKKPNLLFVLTDDQRWDTMGLMPQTKRIFNVNFSQAVVTTPLCCPSRSSYLTGRYVHNTKVFTNRSYPAFKHSEPDSLGPWLKAQGYYTGFVGKYFNYYRLDDPVPPGWDEFHARAWGPQGPNLRGARFALRQKWTDGSGPQNRIVYYPNSEHPDRYFTPVFSEIAVRFLRRAEDPRYNPGRRPWALLLWPNAPNITLAEPRYERADVPAWKPPPSFDERDLSDKPPEVSHGPNRDYGVSFYRSQRSTQLRMVRSVDDLIARVFATLKDLGVRSRTWAIYTSDNGRFWGEHGLSKKLYGYEEGIRVPFRAFVPGRGRLTIDDVVANIDVAPTLLDLAGDGSNHQLDGRSLLPLLAMRPADSREGVLLENWVHLRYEGVRTPRWKLIKWLRSGNTELYDLLKDPFELDNVAARRPSTVRDLLSLIDHLKRTSKEAAARRR